MLQCRTLKKTAGILAVAMSLSWGAACAASEDPARDRLDEYAAYIREHIQVIAAHTEEGQESAGVCISIVAPPFIQFFDSIHNRVDVVMDIEKEPKPGKAGIRKSHI